MGALANKTHVLASTVANNGTFTTAYPSGFDQGSLQGATGGKLAINGDVYSQAAGGFSLSFGASNITVTNLSGQSWAAGAELKISFGRSDPGGTYNVSVGTGKGQAAAGEAARNKVSALTASGVVPADTGILELNHATVVIAATIADLAAFQGLLTVRNTSASGTAAHTVTLTNGSWNGTNKVITLDAPGEAITVRVDSAGRGQIIENTGAVGLSG